MLFLLLALNLWGQDVIIQSEKISDIEYEQYLLENPHKKSYVQNYSQQEVPLSGKLLSLLKKAQYQFINGSLEKSKKLFLEIHDLRYKSDWNLNQRKTIHYALFRLSQLNKNPATKAHYIREAILFDESLIPDENLFPPPMMVQFHKIKNREKTKVWPLPEHSENFKKILINGKAYSSGKSFFQTSSGTKRFSFISNKYKPIHIVSDVKKLSLHKLALIPLAQGNCENPQFLPSLNQKNYLAYFEAQCILPTTMKSISQLQPPLINTPPSKVKKSWKRDNTWIWIGLTALTALATWQILENQQSSPSSPPPPKIQPNETYISNHGASY